MSTAGGTVMKGSTRHDADSVVRPAAARLRRLAWRSLGTTCFVIGAVNAFVPLLPTTVFWIVAVWAFGRSSPELARLLLDHPRFGPALRRWRDHRMMSRRAKWLACSAIGVSYASTLALLGFTSVTLLLGAGLGSLALYLATRLEQPAAQATVSAPLASS